MEAFGRNPVVNPLNGLLGQGRLDLDAGPPYAGEAVTFPAVRLLASRRNMSYVPKQSVKMALGRTAKPAGYGEVQIKTRSGWCGVGGTTVVASLGAPPRRGLVALPLAAAILAAGCATATPAPASVSAKDTCDSPPLPTDFSVPEFSEFGDGRAESTLFLSLLVDEGGQVREAKIETSSGLPAFDQAVLHAARGARFRPGTVDCEPVEQWTTIMIPGEDSSTDSPPEYTSKNEMARFLEREYPVILRDRSIGGTTIVWLHVGERGRVQEVRVLRSSGYRELDRAALRVARAARLEPAMHDGEAVAVWITLPITFATR